MTPDDLIKWHEKRADDASRRGAHTVASKHAKTAHILRAALEPIAPPDVAQGDPYSERICQIGIADVQNRLDQSIDRCIAANARADAAAGQMRERCHGLVVDFPYGADGPSDAQERVSWAIKQIGNAIDALLIASPKRGEAMTAHHYSPNYQAMGDCNVCGLQRDDNPEHEKAYAMTPGELEKYGLRVRPPHHPQIIAAALEPIAPPDVAQAARVLLPWLDNYERTVAKPWRKDSVFSKYDECRHGRYMYEDCLNCLEEDLRAIADGG